MSRRKKQMHHRERSVDSTYSLNTGGMRARSKIDLQSSQFDETGTKRKKKKSKKLKTNTMMSR